MMYNIKMKEFEIDVNNNKINLANGYYLELNKKNEVLIDFKVLEKEDYKKKLKQISRKWKKIRKEKKIGNILNLDLKNQMQVDFIAGLYAISLDDKYLCYEYIYDYVYNYLEEFFSSNPCDFENGKCGEKKNTNVLNGCCHCYKSRSLGPLSKLVACKYLNPKTFKCDAKCIGCKLFTCDYLNSKGISFRIKDFLLLDTFFNLHQKFWIRYYVFAPKQKILKKLVRIWL